MFENTHVAVGIAGVVDDQSRRRYRFAGSSPLILTTNPIGIATTEVHVDEISDIQRFFDGHSRDDLVKQGQMRSGEVIVRETAVVEVPDLVRSRKPLDQSSAGHFAEAGDNGERKPIHLFPAGEVPESVVEGLP